MVPQAAEIGDGGRPGGLEPGPGDRALDHPGLVAVPLRGATPYRAALTLTEKIRAEQNFHDAQQAVDDYLMSVSDDTLLKQQESSEVRQLRKHLLEDALKYYRRFLARQGE